MPAVPDTSPLIAMGKMECVELLPRLYGEVLIAPAVWEEAVTRGKEMGASDAAYLEKSARQRYLVRIRLTAKEKDLAAGIAKVARIGHGEAEALAVAKSRGTLAILDEKGARAAAIGLGVGYIGTIGVLYEAFLHKLISYERLIELLEKLGKIAWVSPDLLANIIKRAREVNGK